MKFFQVMAYEEAKNLIEKNVPSKVLQTELLPLVNCVNRVCAKDIFASEQLPNYSRSTVDGYAVRAEDVFAASEGIPSILSLVGSIKIGTMPTIELKVGQAIEISTGAVLPNNCNAVAMEEHTERLKDKVAIYQALKVRENTVLKGEDLNYNEKVASSGQILTPMLLGVLAGVGVTKVEVFDTVNVAIISTGDELVSVDRQAVDGKIRDINTTVLSALVQDCGWNVAYTKLICDNLDELINAISEATNIADIVLISGGSSVGNADYTRRALEKLGEVKIHGIAIKPGKPTIVAKVKDSLVFGLAGHPLAAALCFKILVEEPIKKARGQSINADFYLEVEESFHSTPGRTNIQPITIINTKEGVFARPIYVKSAYIARASRADGYIILPEKCEGITKGEKVEVYKL